jgi:hypothetical protein
MPEMPSGGYDLINRSVTMRKFPQRVLIDQILKLTLDYLGIVDDTGTLFEESGTVCTLHYFLYFGSEWSGAD